MARWVWLKRNQKGFTLMEILSVVAIIGVILGIGIPIVSNVMKNSSTQEFVSNAKTVEDAVQSKYRDTGVLPEDINVSSTTEKVTQKSKDIMSYELKKAGVPNYDEVVKLLLTESGGKYTYLKKINYMDLKGYSKIRSDDEGAKEFFIITPVDMSTVTGPAKGYQNDIVGMVFSSDVRVNSSDIMYSGAHKLAVGSSVVSDPNIPASQMSPYGFRITDLKDNGDGTASVELTWTEKLVDKQKRELRGYTGKEFELSCDKCTPVKTSAITTLTKTIAKVPIQKVKLTLKGTSVETPNGSLDKTGTDYAYVNGTSDGIVDIADLLKNPGSGTNVPVGDGIEEVTSGDNYENRNELYKYLEEDSTFNVNNVTAVPEGISIAGITVGDYVVLKEIRQLGSTYDFDPNRTRLFQVSKTSVIIPKDPYLQKDFQTNPKSTYQYIVEVYKNKQCPGTMCQSKTAPSNAAVVSYTP